MRIISGKFKGRTLHAPHHIRPTSEQLRGAVFNIAQNVIEGASFLDLFAGSGAMSFEAKSRGADRVVAVELNPKSIDAINKNESLLKSGIKIMAYDAARAVKKLQGQLFDIIFIDPPYDLKIHGAPASEWIAKQAALLLKPGGLLFVEDSGKDPFEVEGLQLDSCRHFGSSRLLLFCKML